MKKISNLMIILLDIGYMVNVFVSLELKCINIIMPIDIRYRYRNNF